MSIYKTQGIHVSVNTRFAALIGWPLGHSASAEMHNEAYAAMNLDAMYLPIPVEQSHVEDMIRAFELIGFMGFNVTIPHKVTVKNLMDELHLSAAESGAVNTVLLRDGRRIGYNTDGTGFVRALKEKGGFDPSGKRCLVVGAGGAARGVASALAMAGAEKFIIANRQEEYDMAERLADDMNSKRHGIAVPVRLNNKNIAESLQESDLVVHATRLGMSPSESTVAFDTSLLSERHFVCDVVYNPRKTRLLREAELRGCRTLDGMWMLVYQGAEAIRIWTGQIPPIEAMANGCVRFLNGLQK